MRTLFGLFALFCALLGGDTLSIDEKSGELHSTPYAQTCIDPDGNYTLDTITGATCFKPDERFSYGFTDATVWTRLRIHNATNHPQEIMGLNAFANLQWIDVLVVYDDNRSERHLLGSMRLQSQRSIAHRLSVFKLYLHEHESANVYTSHRSVNPLNIDWTFERLETFLVSDLKKGELFGLSIGIILALITYNLTLFFSLRDRTYLYYVFFGLGNSVMLSAFYGYFYMHDFGISRHLFLALPNLATLFNPMMLILFTISFFNFKERTPNLYKALLVMIAILGTFFALNLYRLIDPEPIVAIKLQNYVLAICNVTMIGIALYALYRRFQGAVFFFLAILMTVALIIIGFAHFMGKILFFAPIGQYAAVLITLDMFFISLALSQKVSAINRQKQKAEYILLQQTRFSSIGNAIAELVHQIKVPISQLGAVSARISFLTEKYADTIAPKDQDAASDLNKIVHFLDDSVARLHNHYIQSDVCEAFDVTEAIESSVGMFRHRLILHAIEIQTQLHPCHVLGASISLQNVLIAILENAIDILHERQSRNPLIRIYSRCDAKNVVIEIIDNGGGIKSKNPEDIFTMYYSNKATKGFGIGLGLAKNLVEQQLKGTIHADNTEQGARFIITLPFKRT